MGELHCPATVVLASPGVDVHALVARLRMRRVAVVYAGSTAAAHAAAGELAALLGAALRPLVALGGWADAVQALADGHRGETVLVVTADAEPPADGQPVELEVDEQGIRRVDAPASAGGTGGQA